MTVAHPTERWNWNLAFFCGGGKSDKSQENPWRKAKTDNKHSWLVMLGSECKLGHSGWVVGGRGGVALSSLHHPCSIQLHILSVPTTCLVCYRPLAIVSHPHFLIGSWHWWNFVLPDRETVLFRWGLSWSEYECREDGLWASEAKSSFLPCSFYSCPRGISEARPEKCQFHRSE